MTQLKGKIALITGGNSGIGYATAQDMKAKGASVIITGRRKEAVERAARDLGVIGIVADQSKLVDIEYLASEIDRKFGKIDILLVNAGISKFSPIEHMSENLFDEVMDVNFKGAYFTLSRFIPLLNNGSAVILLSSSSASVHGSLTSIYSASKSALNSLVKSAAIELAPRKITVNAVSPGPVATEIMQKIGLNDDLEARILSRVPLGRMGKSQEVASMVSYLASQEATFITGSEFFVDGGHAIND